MSVDKILYTWILYLFALKCAWATECPLRCSRVLEPVCGLVAVGAARDRRLYHNTCHLHKIQCLLKKDNVAMVKELPARFCSLKKIETGNIMYSRRYIDNTIVGSRNMCNHSCPTHCTDLYDPVCANVFEHDIKDKTNHILVNHCHADLLSCALQLNVLVETIDHCLGPQTQFAYSALAQAAVLKSIGLMNV